ncbi:DNA replication licensing factor MCM5 like AAA+ ATPase [Cryptosporidium ubiquitum]|uniref:DNA replication licensing factor MCM5 n=1 Tax=Cryptosporidium ubiquitum TaxID=857276 RepID=A0A1J4MKU2_9CRYT|nr:DNA replication licensing factor MCM5 like AAA+ ATPase [Cryptosporidium ubiquitum]OII74832.1 DNA replication licensing factor MCM5 like AAA+ ATPase [Cryptosporidium ubiquitum]
MQSSIGTIYYSNPPRDLEKGDWNGDTVNNTTDLLSAEECRNKFSNFIKNFNQSGDYIYREMLINNVSIGEYTLRLELHHLSIDEVSCSEIGEHTENASYDGSLINGRENDSENFHNGVRNNELSCLIKCFKNAPLKYIPICEGALKRVYLELVGKHKKEITEEEINRLVPDIQLQIVSNQEPTLIRDLKSNVMEKLVTVPGIVIQSSKPQKKASKLKILCRQCKGTRNIAIPIWRQGTILPRVCNTAPIGEAPKCPLDPYFTLSDESEYIDIQSMKFQELPEHVPTGDIPRHISLHMTRGLVDKVIPGNRLYVVGVLSSTDKESSKVHSNSRNGSLRTSYLYVIGVMNYGSNWSSKNTKTLMRSSSMSNQYNEIEEFRRISSLPNIHELIVNSIAPAIYGNETIKQAIACLLFSGSSKCLPDGNRIRGDLNILLLGDPSTAKSQLLKFVEQVAPICIYTSGKGSSAAGLTAAIVRDHANGVYALEGGAMVLADGGVVCIDEFDKMRDDDRVAIHEAMEQQTISIAKAGITTILKARCSVLAAANPTFGSYDDSKDLTQQHDFESTILSRFDLIFLLKDEKNVDRDRLIASHIVELHSGSNGKTNVSNSESTGSLQFELLQKYINYCREFVHPRLSLDAAAILENFYVQIREDNREKTNKANKERIPITVRQLEAITRIAESFAKMEMQVIANEKHVEMAIKLFKNATIEAIKSNILLLDNLSPAEQSAIIDAEVAIKNRIPIKARAGKTTIIKDLVLVGYDPYYLSKAMKILIQKGDLIERSDFSIFRVK